MHFLTSRQLLVFIHFSIISIMPPHRFVPSLFHVRFIFLSQLLLTHRDADVATS